MPITLKKEKMKPCNIRFRIAAIAGLGITVIFSVLFGIFVEKIAMGDKNSVIVIAVFFFLYLASCVVSMILGVKTYLREDNGAVLFQSVLLFAPIIFCIMNLKTALLMILVVFDKDSAAIKLLGDHSYFEYISTQYSSWICLMIGLVVTMVIGILAVVTLLKNKK